MKTQSESQQSTSTGSALNDLINKCKRAAFDLALRYPSEIAEFHTKFPNVVGQDRLAYVWYASDINQQHQCSEDPNETDCNCDVARYGLDCSGLIYQVFNRAGLLIARMNTGGYANISNWNSALDKSTIYSGIKAIDITKGLNIKYDLREGDIVVRAGHHMGMVFDSQISNQSSRIILNSFGKPKNDCKTNSDIKHGPVAMNPDDDGLKSLFGRGYKVFRFTNPQSQYTLLTSLRINLVFAASGPKPSFVYAEYFLGATVYDSKGQTVPGVTVRFTSDMEKYLSFDHPTMATPVTNNRLRVSDRSIPVLIVSATMPDGTFLEDTRQPSFSFDINQPSIAVGSTTKITMSVINKNIN